jgi:hypothetical protein
MVVDPRYVSEAVTLIDSRLGELRSLSFQEASSLQAISSEEVLIHGTKASIAVFRQSEPYGLSGKVLIAVLVARPKWFGMASHHIEKGLVFSPGEGVRAATETELQNSGG